MTAFTAQPARVAPMPAGRRFGIATGASVALHAIILIAIGLLASRAQVVRQVLIPVEITVEKPAETPVEQRVVLGGGGHREGPLKVTDAPAIVAKPVKRPPSSAGGRAKAAPAPPRILTSKGGKTPSGPVGKGREPSGAGGKEDSPGGPTYGPGVVGGPLAVYPKNALDQDLEGTVTVSVAVGPEGAITSVSVAKSSGHRLLDDAAVRAVKAGWTFKPGMRKGKPAEGEVSVTFVFSAGSVKRG